MKLIVRRKFDAAHRLDNYHGPCANVHGHTWRVEVVFDAGASPPIGYYESITEDFKYLKNAIDDLLPDHTMLNERFAFNPTAENIALYLKRQLDIKMKRGQYECAIESVRVWESDDCGAEASG